jgi:glycylpeptide N-tetradecanoyltransferase
MELLSFQQKPAKTTEEALQKQYQFWNTQPVPKMGKKNNFNCTLPLIGSRHTSMRNKIYIEFLCKYICLPDEKISTNEPIEPDKAIQDIRQEPYSLPDGFQWDTLNLDEPLVVSTVNTIRHGVQKLAFLRNSYG